MQLNIFWIEKVTTQPTFGTFNNTKVKYINFAQNYHSMIGYCDGTPTLRGRRVDVDLFSGYILLTIHLRWLGTWDIIESVFFLLKTEDFIASVKTIEELTIH